MLNYIKKCGLAWLLALAMLFSVACADTDTTPISTSADTHTQESTENITETEDIASTESDEQSSATQPTDATESTEETEDAPSGSITILNGSEKTVEIGDEVKLTLYKSISVKDEVVWTVEGGSVTVDSEGNVTAIAVGHSIVIATAGEAKDSIIIHVVEKSEETTVAVTTESETEPETETEPSGLPTVNEEQRDKFYGDSTPAKNNQDAADRSSQGQLSGADFVPDQAPTISEYRPMVDGKYVRNSEMYFADEDTYIVVNAYGEEVFRVYRDGAYITLEEVAAYVYAFGDIPANYVASKSTKPSSSIFGKYLRLNHSRFSGSTSKYPYEPELPNISGCGGSLQYYEIDIGTTGTDCDPSYIAKIYNNGSSITRGAARIVYTKYDGNGNGVIELNETYVFYTYNHYNDFQEYLNYYGGWGEMFGNVTGGGTLSSKYDYNPTPYVPVVMKSVRAMAHAKTAERVAEPTYFVAMILPQELYYMSKF